MFLTLEDQLYNMWEKALEDRLTINISTKKEQAILYKGIKVIKDGSKITIYNTKKGGLNYAEVSYDDYIYFAKHGIRKGCVYVLKRTYIEQIEALTKKIRNEVLQRNNKKHYDALKTKRENVINKYTQINKKIKL